MAKLNQVTMVYVFEVCPLDSKKEDVVGSGTSMMQIQMVTWCTKSGKPFSLN